MFKRFQLRDDKDTVACLFCEIVSEVREHYTHYASELAVKTSSMFVGRLCYYFRTESYPS